MTEFRKHQKIDNPLHIIGFLSQWKLYLDDLPSSPTDTFTGRKLDPSVVEKVLLVELAYQDLVNLMNFRNRRCHQSKLASCMKSCTRRRTCGSRQRPRPPQSTNMQKVCLEVNLNSSVRCFKAGNLTPFGLRIQSARHPRMLYIRVVHSHTRRRLLFHARLVLNITPLPMVSLKG